MLLLSLGLVGLLGACTTNDVNSASGGTDESGSGTESTTTGEDPTTTGEDPTTTGEDPTTTGGEDEDCGNGLDDNSDGLIDCDDPECAGDLTCGAPEGWTCPPEFYDEDETMLMMTCDCACGIPDPDCEQNLDNGVFNCGPGQTCSPRGECIDPPPEVCDGGEDEDLDALVDCDDPDCFGELGCPPEGWTCAGPAYDQAAPDEVCDCECGALDPDCENPDNPSSDCEAGTACNTDALSCDLITGEVCDNDSDDDDDGLADCEDQECYGVGSCPVPGWLCNPALYASGGDDAACDCNCGAYDPDCDVADAPIFGCASPDAICTDEGACEVPLPDEWTCSPLFFASNDGCDCGCGAFDPDCASEKVDACMFCSNMGSCNMQMGCPGDINPSNNAVCN